MDNKILKSNSQRSMESRKKTSDQIQFIVLKGEREKIKAFAQARGLSLNEFIRLCIRKEMER